MGVKINESTPTPLPKPNVIIFSILTALGYFYVITVKLFVNIYFNNFSRFIWISHGPGGNILKNRLSDSHEIFRGCLSDTKLGNDLRNPSSDEYLLCYSIFF